jgi:diaminohydroxyphosphoribosylaminopyrimidine deaminase/5-amino-6-(5-phosphoribosylamino)uracil reductase
MATDEFFMKRAITLARRGASRVSPNPLVGAVVVREGKIIGEGYHRACGSAHAEIEAIRQVGGLLPPGATLYVNLEPCCHHGRTPPCVEAIVAAGPARVVVGVLDPNPRVAGKGIARLERKGIATSVGVLEEECRRLNEVFFHWMETGRPLVTLKFAQTLDGRIATATGDSRWISNLAARRFAHRLRAANDAIAVGVGTIRQDDPELTTRLVKGRNPLRVILDSRLSLPETARVLTSSREAATLIVTTDQADPEKRERLEARGITIETVSARPGGEVDLAAMLTCLGKREVSSLLVEGGAGLLTSFISQSLADRLILVLAPKIVGSGVNSLGDLGVRQMEEAIVVKDFSLRRLGDNLVLKGRLGRKSRFPDEPAAEPPSDGSSPRSIPEPRVPVKRA